MSGYELSWYEMSRYEMYGYEMSVPQVHQSRFLADHRERSSTQGGGILKYIYWKASVHIKVHVL